MKYTIILISYLLNIQGCSGQSQEGVGFDSVKWKESSEYRYEIIKSPDFPSLEGQTKEYVKEILGNPDFLREGNYIYCFDISNQKKLTSVCKGSYMIVNFEKNNPYNVTIVNVEPVTE